MGVRRKDLDRWTYGFYHDGLGGYDYHGNDIFSHPNGVRDWIGPSERSLNAAQGGRQPKSPGVTHSPGRPSAMETENPLIPGVPKLFSPIGSQIGAQGKTAERNLLDPESPQGSSFFPGQAVHSPYGAAAGPRGPAAFAGSLASGRSFLPSRPKNLLASAPAFDNLYGTPRPPVGSAQANPGTSSAVSGKPLYSVKDRLDFIGRVYPYAKAFSEQTGLSLPFILAHTAHEVGWGKNIEGNNLFNLKADESWHGPTYTRDGARHRAYPNLKESMKDYQALLEGDPRYFKMFNPGVRTSVDRLADALLYAGYSEDPLYSRRVMAVARSPLMKRALWQYEKWPPEAAGQE